MKRLTIIPLLMLCQVVFTQSFTGINPKYEEYLEPGVATFQWNDIGAPSYTLQIADTPAFSNIIISENTTNNQVTISSALSSGVYYWRVSDGAQYSPIYLLNVFLPSDDPDLRLWLDPQTGVVQNGMGQVSSWSDPLNGLSFDQNNNVEQPQFEPNGFMGHPEIQFNGGQVLEGGNVLNLNTSDHSFLVIAKANGNGQAILSKSIAAGQPDRYSLFSSGGETKFLYHDNANRTVAYNSLFSQYGLYNVSVDRSNDFVSLQFNDNNLITNAIDNSHNMNSSFRFLVGAYNANPDDSEVLHLDGAISEIILMNTVETSSTKNMRGYIKHKYMPKLDLGEDKLIPYSYCDSVQLDAGGDYKSYVWNNDSTTQTIWANGPGKYSVEVVDSLGFSWKDTIEVFYPEPDHPSSNIYCPSDSTTWYTNLGPDYNYLWSDGSTADSLTIDTPGDYHVQITDTNGCVFQSDTLTFDADPFESIVTLGPDQNLCTGNTLTLQDGDSLAVDYLWSTGSTDSSIVLNATDTYFVDVVNANGCEASDTIDVSIIGDAPIVTIGAPTTVCEGELFTFEDFSNTTDGSTITNWSWDLDDGTVISVEDSSHVYSANGSYNMSLTISTSAGCSNTDYQQIDVIPKPEMTFVSAGQCQNSSIQFNGGQLSPTTINTWEWNFDDPSSGSNNTASGQNSSHIFSLALDYDVQLVGTDINGCRDTVVQTVEILPAPQVDFAFDEVCVGDVVNFENLTSIDPPGIVNSYNWSFGDGTTSGQTEPQRPYNSSGNYTVNLVATSDNGCSGQLSQNLKVHAIPVVDQVVESSCAGLNTEFIDNSFVANGSVAQVLWSLNNGAPLSGFTVNEVFDESGTVEVEQTVTSSFGCTNSNTFNITINDYIEAGFEYSPNALIAGSPTEFTSTSIGADFYEWTIESVGSSVLPDTTVIFPESLTGDTLDVELAVENSFGCRDSVMVSLPVLERSTDLLVDELFLQEVNGFYTVGVRLTNLGTTPISEVDLIYNAPSTPALKETWEGLLQASETTIYVFESSPSSGVPLADTAKNYVCVQGSIIQPDLFTEADLSNNEVCNLIEPSESVVIAPQPNPINELYSVKVILSTSEKGTLKVFDAQGREVDVIFENEMLNEGLNTYEVDASNYANGGYTLRYVGEQQTEQVKIVKQ